MAKATKKRREEGATFKHAGGGGWEPVGKSAVNKPYQGVLSNDQVRITGHLGAKGSVRLGTRLAGIHEADFTYTAADDNKLLHIIDIVRSGITPTDFSALAAKIPFTITEWADYLQISERTIQRNQKEQKAFQPIQSEKIVELAMLYNYGLEVFGNKESLDSWLDAYCIALGGRKPKDLLDTNFGITLVKDELGRIEHGVLA